MNVLTEVMSVCAAQIQRFLQDIDKRDYQIETLKDQQNEGQKREENLKRQLDKLTYDNNSLHADLSSNRDELDEARKNISVTRSCHVSSSQANVILLSDKNCNWQCDLRVISSLFSIYCQD